MVGSTLSPSSPRPTAATFPPGLTSGASPTEFRLPPEGRTLPDAPGSGDDKRIVSLRYLRRTAIGAPRLLKDASPGADPEPAVFPLPSREEPWPVFPLVEDLVGRSILIDKTYPDLTDPKALDPFQSRARPASDEIGRLAVLAPLSKLGNVWKVDPDLWDRSPQVAHSVRFALAPPSVPVNDWVLWRTRDLDFGDEPQQTIRDDIRDILAAFHQAELNSGATARKDGRAPDDPAVEHLVVRVTKVFERGTAGRTTLGTWSIWLKDRGKKTADATPKPEDLWRWQTRPVPIWITAVDDATDADLDLPGLPRDVKFEDQDKNNDKKRSLKTVNLMAEPVVQGPIDQPVEGLQFFVAKGTVYRFEFFAGVPESLFVSKTGDIELARIRSLTPAFTLGPDRDPRDPKATLRADEPSPMRPTKAESGCFR
jgi:hypothetical protein